MKTTGRFFSKAIPEMSKLSHLRLNFRSFDDNLALIKQNVINRNAQSKRGI